MSPQDISRIQPIAPSRSLARGSGDRLEQTSVKPAVDRQGDSSVKVETGAPVGNGVSPGQPPVDQPRVELIRDAIKQGTYPVNPAKIADAMIAAPLLLRADR